jgi:hypothetical protein
MMSDLPKTFILAALLLLIADLAFAASATYIGNAATRPASKPFYEIMTDKKAPPAARTAAATALLDRGYGRAEQSFTGSLNAHYSISDKPMTAEEWAREYAAPLTH